MIRASGLLGLLLTAQLAGCASPPAPECESADTAYHIQLAAGGVEAGGPATLPLEPELTGPHPVEFYVRLALERNPEVLAAQRLVAAQAERIPQVTALEDPMLTDTFWPITDHSPQTASGRMPNSLMISQKFPWLAKLRVRGEVAEQEARIALTELAEAQLDVIEDVHLAYYELYYVQQAMAITLDSQGLAEDLIELGEARLRTGGSQQDVVRAQLELDRIRERLIVLRQQLRVAQADLARLLHASPDVLPEVEKQLTLPPTPEAIDRLYELAVRCRPELEGRLSAIVRDERQRELAALEYYPDVTLGISWDYMTLDDAAAVAIADGNDNIGFSVGVNLPIWRDRLRAGVRESEHRLVASARRYDAARDDAFRTIRQLIAQAAAAEQQIVLYRESILPRANQRLDLGLAEYRTTGGIFVVLEDWRELLMFQIQLARFQADLGRSLASLERAVGCQLAALPEPGAPLPVPETPDAPEPAPAPVVPPQPAPEPDVS